MSAKKVRLHAQLLVALLAAASFASFSPTTLAQRSSPVAPKREQFEATVREAYEKFRDDRNGKNADYIPYLAHVDSKLFGIAAVTTDNQVFTLGDVNYSFSIQSISKVYTLALAMEELGADKCSSVLVLSRLAGPSILSQRLWICRLTQAIHS